MSASASLGSAETGVSIFDGPACWRGAARTKRSSPAVRIIDQAMVATMPARARALITLKSRDGGSLPGTSCKRVLIPP
ncbi:hypothetical protein MCHI_000053 [Candidatus Magnetoovum chiemensis]|nr:hypothetical protein MCHI_000053 [Candidatus Magnetoovum chiemensis]